SKQHHLKPTILLSTQPINPTLSPTKQHTHKYIHHIHPHSPFPHLTFKIHQPQSHPFKNIHLPPTPQILALHLQQHINPPQITPKYYSPKQFKPPLQHENTLILHPPNHYQYDLPHFRPPIPPDITPFPH
ncbi:rhodanese-like domain-containing protein, partial [Staphylococcus epidermidis]